MSDMHGFETQPGDVSGWLVGQSMGNQTIAWWHRSGVTIFVSVMGNDDEWTALATVSARGTETRGFGAVTDSLDGAAKIAADMIGNFIEAVERSWRERLS